jgi:hypothetical protein
MAHVVQIILKAEDQASPVVEKVSDTLGKLKEVWKEFSAVASPLREQLQGLSERLRNATEAAELQGRIWDGYQGVYGLIGRKIATFSDEAAASFADVSKAFADLTVDSEKNAERQYNVWSSFSHVIESTFSTVFQRLIRIGGDAGDVLADVLARSMERMAVLAASTEIIIPVTTRLIGPIGLPRRTAAQTGLTELISSAASLVDNRIFDPGYSFAGAAPGSAYGLPSGPTTGMGLWATISPYLGPAALVASIGIPLLSKLFEDRPQPRFDTKSFVPGTYDGLWPHERRDKNKFLPGCPIPTNEGFPALNMKMSLGKPLRKANLFPKKCWINSLSSLLKNKMKGYERSLLKRHYLKRCSRLSTKPNK